MMFMVMHALGEMAIMYPVSGGFYTYSVRFIDPSWGFAMGYNYVFQVNNQITLICVSNANFSQWMIVLPLELTVAGLVLQYWDGARAVSNNVWIAVFWIAIIIINIFGTLGFAEEEFWSSCLKLATIGKSSRRIIATCDWTNFSNSHLHDHCRHPHLRRWPIQRYL